MGMRGLKIRSRKKLNICRQVLTSSTQPKNKSFHVVDRTIVAAKCTKMKNARAKRAKLLFFIISYANVRRCCRRANCACTRTVLSPPCPKFLIIKRGALGRV